jgi:hypothetical protein
VLELLAAHVPRPGGDAESEGDLRSFEWYHLWHLCHQDRRTIEVHQDLLSELAVSPDGRLLATGAGLLAEHGPGEIKLWDAATGPLRPEMKH